MHSAVAEDLPMEILFEDKWLIVVNKAAGMVVHPGAGHSTGTLVSALLHHGSGLSTAGGDLRPGIVHRLDKETSGCLVVAKTDEVHAALAAQFEERSISKVYLAAVAGRLRKPSGRVDAPIGRHAVHRQKMAILPEGRGREALTEYRMLAMHEGVSLVECKPRTGRTHQIRVHLKHLGCPVLGDPVYGRREHYSRHLLHAWKLSFRHPKTGAPVSAVAPPPADFFDPLPAAIRAGFEALQG
jgi:23S rRNA pseudouridine1911/1915/1917 synthase